VVYKTAPNCLMPVSRRGCFQRRSRRLALSA
jgi:hypothetical protein